MKCATLLHSNHMYVCMYVFVFYNNLYNILYKVPYNNLRSLSIILWVLILATLARKKEKVFFF